MFLANPFPILVTENDFVVKRQFLASGRMVFLMSWSLSSEVENASSGFISFCLCLSWSFLCSERVIQIPISVIKIARVGINTARMSSVFVVLRIPKDFNV